MAVKILIKDLLGSIKGLYSGNSLSELLVSVHEGDTYEEVDASFVLPDVDMSDDAHYTNYVIKKAKLDSVATIRVVVGNKVLDGDEISQSRMLRAIQIAAIASETTTMWKLADNSIVEVTLDELKEALALSGKEMSKIWLGE